MHKMHLNSLRHLRSFFFKILSKAFKQHAWALMSFSNAGGKQLRFTTTLYTVIGEMLSSPLLPHRWSTAPDQLQD